VCTGDSVHNLDPAGMPEVFAVEFRTYRPREASAIEALFVAVFSASEGPREGALIGKLVGELMATTDARDLHGWVATDGAQLVGAAFFSRLRFATRVEAFILAPVAVDSARQRTGIGQALIGHGLRAMERRGASLVMTYGDPAFYARTGFRPVSPDVVPPPFTLSRPEGWLGQSLTDEPIRPLRGPGACVGALQDPAYW